MNRLLKLILVLIVCVLTSATVCRVRAQVSGDNVKTFFNSDMPGMTIQANATAETKDLENLTLWLRLMPQANVYVELFSLEVSGFINGTARVSMGNITASDLPNGTSSYYSKTLLVPDGVSGVTFAEFTLKYSISLGALDMRFPNVTSGFRMTLVDNKNFESLQSQLLSLNDSYSQLNETYTNLTSEYLQLNQTYLQLQKDCSSMQGSVDELDNTRRVAVILAITTVFFVATTFLMVVRKPNESW